LATSFASLRDPRVERTKHHQLLDIVLIAICAVVCGAEGWVELAAFGRYHGVVTLIRFATFARRSAVRNNVIPNSVQTALLKASNASGNRSLDQIA
jgi:hypothetical protein